MVRKILIWLVSLVMGMVSCYFGYGLINVLNTKFNLDLNNTDIVIINICGVAIPMFVMSFILVNEAFGKPIKK